MPVGTFSPCCSTRQRTRPTTGSARVDRLELLFGGSANIHDLVDLVAGWQVVFSGTATSNVGDSGRDQMATVSINLPAPLTRFVGREAELAQAAALLAQGRLLTLIGPGGAGKTRLAVQLAGGIADQFPDGVWFVDFSPLADGTFGWVQVAMPLGVKDPGRGKTWAETLGRFLATRQALLVLDHSETLVEFAAEVTNALLVAAPGLKVAATSREPLGVGGELTWPVPVLSEVDSVELFIDRARHVRPDFSLRAEDADAVRSICRRLDGLPLA